LISLKIYYVTVIKFRTIHNNGKNLKYSWTLRLYVNLVCPVRIIRPIINSLLNLNNTKIWILLDFPRYLNFKLYHFFWFLLCNDNYSLWEGEKHNLHFFLFANILEKRVIVGTGNGLRFKHVFEMSSGFRAMPVHFSKENIMMVNCCMINLTLVIFKRIV
jgi:hypothetical protein